MTAVLGVLWWATLGGNGLRALLFAAGSWPVWLNLFAQLLNGGGRSLFELHRRRAPHRLLLHPAALAFVFENLSHLLACVSILALTATAQPAAIGLELLVNLAFLATGLLWARRGPARRRPFLVAWRVSLPLTTLPVLLAIHASGQLSLSVGAWFAAMAVCRLLAIWTADHSGTATLATAPQRLERGKWWFPFCAGGAWIEMSVALELLRAGG